MEQGNGDLWPKRLTERPPRGAALIIEILGDAHVQTVAALIRPKPGGQIEVRDCRQTEENDILLRCDRFEIDERLPRGRVTLPEGKRTAVAKQVFHRPAHFAVVQDKHPI